MVAIYHRPDRRVRLRRRAHRLRASWRAHPEEEVSKRRLGTVLISGCWLVARSAGVSRASASAVVFHSVGCPGMGYGSTVASADGATGEGGASGS